VTKNANFASRACVLHDLNIGNLMRYHSGDTRTSQKYSRAYCLKGRI